MRRSANCWPASRVLGTRQSKVAVTTTKYLHINTQLSVYKSSLYELFFEVI